MTTAIDVSAGRVVLNGTRRFDTADQHLHLTKQYVGQISYPSKSLSGTVVNIVEDHETILGPHGPQDVLVVGGVKVSAPGTNELSPLNTKWMSVGGTIYVQMHSVWLSRLTTSFNREANPNNFVLIDVELKGGNCVLTRKHRAGWHEGEANGANWGFITPDFYAMTIDYRLYSGAWT